MSALRDRLKQILQDGSICCDSQGREPGDVHIDSGNLALDPEGVSLISEIFLREIIKNGDTTAVGCTWSAGGSPIVGAVIYKSRKKDKPLRGFMVRKERKAHGTRSVVEGGAVSGSRIFMVEDVVNTGESMLTAISRLEGEGAKVEGVLCVVDRGTDTEKVFSEKGYGFFSIFKLSELL